MIKVITRLTTIMMMIILIIVINKKMLKAYTGDRRSLCSSKVELELCPEATLKKMSKARKASAPFCRLIISALIRSVINTPHFVSSGTLNFLGRPILVVKSKVCTVFGPSTRQVRHGTTTATTKKMTTLSPHGKNIHGQRKAVPGKSPRSRFLADRCSLVFGGASLWDQLSTIHGCCWKTFLFFSYCGLVENPH